MIRKRVVIVCMMLVIGSIHFIAGENYGGPYPGFVNGYLLDILVPLGVYFLLSLTNLTFLGHWAARSLSVLGMAFAVEIAQYFGLPLFGRTYDPMDLVMYLLGIILAVSFDEILFPRIFAFWRPGTVRPT